MTHIEINNKKLPLVFDVLTLMNIEKSTDINMLNLNLSDIGISECIVIAHEGIKSGGGKITLEELAKDFKGGHFSEVLQAFAEQTKNVFGETGK
jgi:hypothetical protein